MFNITLIKTLCVMFFCFPPLVNAARPPPNLAGIFKYFQLDLPAAAPGARGGAVELVFTSYYRTEYCPIRENILQITVFAC